MVITTGEQTGSATYGVIKLAGLAGILSTALGVAGVIVDQMWRIPDLSFGLLAMSGVPTALALCAYATQVFRDGRLPGWTACLAVTAGLANLMLLASLVIRSGFFSLEAGVIIAIPGTLFIWIIGMSVTMMRTGRSAAWIGG